MNWILLQILVVSLKILRFVIDKLSDIIYYAIYESRASIKLPPIENRILLMPATTIANKIRSRDLTSYEVCEAFILFLDPSFTLLLSAGLYNSLQ